MPTCSSLGEATVARRGAERRHRQPPRGCAAPTARPATVPPAPCCPVRLDQFPPTQVLAASRCLRLPFQFVRPLNHHVQRLSVSGNVRPVVPLGAVDLPADLEA